MSWVHRTIVVPAAYADLARALAAAAAGDAGAGMFSTPLSATGTGEASHYASAGLMQPEFADLLADPQGVYDAAGGSVPLATITDMLNASTIRADADPHAVLAELGLSIINPE